MIVHRVCCFLSYLSGSICQCQSVNVCWRCLVWNHLWALFVVADLIMHCLIISLLLFVCHLVNVTLLVTHLSFASCFVTTNLSLRACEETLSLPWRWWVACWSPFLPVVWSPMERGRSESLCTYSSSVKRRHSLLLTTPAGCVISPPARCALVHRPPPAILLSLAVRSVVASPPSALDSLSPSAPSSQDKHPGVVVVVVVLGGWVRCCGTSVTHTHTHKWKDTHRHAVVHTNTHVCRRTHAQKERAEPSWDTAEKQ